MEKRYNENAIRIHYSNDAFNLQIVWDRDKEKLPRFPIQMVEDSFGSKWITLLDDIDFDGKRYYNINLFFSNDSRNPFCTKEQEAQLVLRLMNGHNHANFSEGDIIRNPTIEECIDIMNTLRGFGYRYNRKRHKFEKVNK
jgi:hypothetical protein